MKRTTTINLAGMVYHIEEDGFQHLQSYFKEIKRVFATQEGVEEMVADIEVRIAELFQERLSKTKEVVTALDVQEVIDIMGNPSQFEEGEESSEQETNSQAHSETKTKKRLYRDKEEGIIGGVAAGIGHYVNVDPVIIRFAWLLLFLLGGSGILVYIVAMIIIPEAKTTAQKLEMRGQSANLDNIKSFAESVSDEAKSSWSKLSNSLKTTFSLGGEILEKIARFVLKFVGFSLFFGALAIFFVFISSFWNDVSIVSINGVGFNTNFSDFLPIIFAQGSWMTWCIFLFLLIPLMMLMMLGIKMVTKRKTKSKFFFIGLFVIWTASFVCLSIAGVQTGLQFRKEFKQENTTTLETATNQINFQLVDDHGSFSSISDIDYSFFLNATADSVSLGYTIIEIVAAKDSNHYSYQVKRLGNGNSVNAAKERTKNIQFNPQMLGDTLKVPTFFTFPTSDYWRGQHVKLKVEVPLGKSIVLHGNLDDYPISIKSDTPVSDDFMERSSIWSSSTSGMQFKGFVNKE